MADEEACTPSGWLAGTVPKSCRKDRQFIGFLISVWYRYPQKKRLARGGCYRTLSYDSSCSSDEGTIFRHYTRSVGRHKSVRQSLHEAHNRIFLRVRKAEPPNSALVHVFGRLGRRPACCAFTDVMGLAAWKYVARVVEVHDRLQALEVTIVHIGFHKAGVGPLVHIPECPGTLNLELGCLAPAFNSGSAARAAADYRQCKRSHKRYSILLVALPSEIECRRTSTHKHVLSARGTTASERLSPPSSGTPTAEFAVLIRLALPPKVGRIMGAVAESSCHDSVNNCCRM